jgi:multiple sugar transport system substrate-binding protein
MTWRIEPPIAGLLASLALLGCGGPSAGKTTEVVYNCAANAADVKALAEQIPAFEAESGVTITLNPFTGQEKLYAMMAAGQAPDIFYTNTTMRDRLAAEGRLLDLRSVSGDDPFPGRLLPGILEGGTSADGGWYSVDNWSYTAGVYYSRDAFDRAGLPYPDSSWTWETMLSCARRLTRDANGDGTPEEYGIFIGSHFVECLEQMNGADICPNALQASIGPRSAEAFDRYLQLMREGLMPDLRRIQAMGMQPAQLLQTGRAAMLVEAVPHQVLIETLAIRWGVAPLPRFERHPPRYFRSGSGGLSISSATRHPEAAWKALKWIIGAAPVYQPNPVLRDVDFVGGWEKRYPALVGSGFREVWNLSLRHDGGDARFFVRYSSWTSASILERLQPLLDRLWAGSMTTRELVEAMPSVNANVERDLRDLLSRRQLTPAFRAEIERKLKELTHAPQR